MVDPGDLEALTLTTRSGLMALPSSCRLLRKGVKCWFHGTVSRNPSLKNEDTKEKLTFSLIGDSHGNQTEARKREGLCGLFSTKQLPQTRGEGS